MGAPGVPMVDKDGQQVWVQPTDVKAALADGAQILHEMRDASGKGYFVRTSDMGNALREGWVPAVPMANTPVPAALQGPADKPTSLWDSAKNAVKNFAASWGMNAEHPVDATLEELKHPVDTVVNAVKRTASMPGDFVIGQGQVAQRGLDEIKNGQPGTGTMDLLYSAIPFIGPNMSKGGHQFAEGDYSGGIGTTAGVGSQVALMSPEVRAGMARVAEVPKAAASAAVNRVLRTPTPEAALTRGLKPGTNATNFRQAAQTALPEIVTQEGIQGTPATAAGETPIRGLLQTIGDAKKRIWQEYAQTQQDAITPEQTVTEQIPGTTPEEIAAAQAARQAQQQAGSMAATVPQRVTGQGNVLVGSVGSQASALPSRMLRPVNVERTTPAQVPQVDTGRVMQAVEESVSNYARAADPELAARVSERAQRIYGNGLNAMQAEDYLQTLNARLSAYYRKNGIDQATAVKADPEIAATVAERDALANALYDALPDGARQLKQKYGALKEVEMAALKRANVSERQAPISLPEGLGYLGAALGGGYEVASGHAPVGALTGTAVGLGARYIRNANSSEALINRALEMQRSKTPQPTPLRPPHGTRGLANAIRNRGAK